MHWILIVADNDEVEYCKLDTTVKRRSKVEKFLSRILKNKKCIQIALQLIAFGPHLIS